jgi:hypothetical protein
MKNYAYMIFFDHFITPDTSSIHTETVTSRSATAVSSAMFSLVSMASRSLLSQSSSAESCSS